MQQEVPMVVTELAQLQDTYVFQVRSHVWQNVDYDGGLAQRTPPHPPPPAPPRSCCCATPHLKPPPRLFICTIPATLLHVRLLFHARRVRVR